MNACRTGLYSSTGTSNLHYPIALIIRIVWLRIFRTIGGVKLRDSFQVYRSTFPPELNIIPIRMVFLSLPLSISASLKSLYFKISISSFLDRFHISVNFSVICYWFYRSHSIITRSQLFLVNRINKMGLFLIELFKIFSCSKNICTFA